MDIHLVINEFLKDKTHLIDYVNDSYNIVDNEIFRWDFTNIPQPSKEELDSIAQTIQG